MSDLSLTLIIIGLQTFITIVLSLIGWMGKQMWELIRVGQENGESSHGKIYDKLNTIEDEVQENTIVLNRVEGVVDRNEDKIKRNHQRLKQVENNHE